MKTEPKYGLTGSWTKMVGNQHTSISEEEARRLLVPCCRNVDEAVASLKDNPFGPMIADDCLLRFEPTVETPTSSEVDGPRIELVDSTPAYETAQQLNALMKRYEPVIYVHRMQVFEEIDPQDPVHAQDLDQYLALAMELLDEAAPAELVFTAKSVAKDDGTTVNVLGFWPVENSHD